MIECIIFGSSKEDAPVIVCLHGSGQEALSEVSVHKAVFDALGVQGIAISLLSYAYNHLTYVTEHFLKPENSMAKTLLADLNP